MAEELLREAFVPAAHGRLLADALGVIATLRPELMQPAPVVLSAFRDRAADATYEFPGQQDALASASHVVAETGCVLARHGKVADDVGALLAACAATAAFYRVPLTAPQGRHWSVGADVTVALLRAIESTTSYELVQDGDPYDEDRGVLEGPTLALVPQ